LDLRGRPHSEPGLVGHDELTLAVLAGIKSVVQAERGVLDRCDPVLVVRDIAQEFTLHVRYPPHHHGLFAGLRSRRGLGHGDAHPPQCEDECQ